MRLFDTHAHIDQVEDIEGVLRRASEAGVEGILAVSVDLASSRKVLEIKGKYQQPKIYAGCGIHPGELREEEVEPTLELIRRNKDDLTVIGEIGLDYWYRWVRKNEEKKQEQCRVFKLQLELAKELDLPVTIHSRGAWADCFRLTQDVGIKKAIFHWYSGPVDVLKQILDVGYFVSATPSLSYSPQAQEAIAFAPIEQTLIETDSPVFYKVSDEGIKAEPKDVFKTLAIYAKLKGVDPEKAADILNANAKRAFYF